MQKEIDLFSKISNLLDEARKKVAYSINTTMAQTYFYIGQYIVEDEQNGNSRAEYGKEVLKTLSQKLTAKYGKGFSLRNLEQMRSFYLTYSIKISQTVSDLLLTDENTQTLSAKFELSYSHYLFLIRIQNPDERNFYEKEAIACNWSLRELKRQFDSALYERLALSKDKNEVKQLAEKGLVVQTPQDIVKDPYVLEFLGLEEKHSYSETELEQSLINKLETFLLELGKGYTFVGRQVRLTFDEKHFYIDLVFYNRLLQCFVLIDLKIGEITHQDLGQMQMYVNYYDRFMKLEHENKTVGIVLCKKKDDALVEITLPEDNTQIFASKYQTVLPDKEVLKKLIQ